MCLGYISEAALGPDISFWECGFPRFALADGFLKSKQLLNPSKVTMS
jgi:hypothetical protein